MFPNIAKFDFQSPIKKLADYYESTTNYFTNIHKHIKDLPQSTILLNKSDPILDPTILEYIKCRPNVKITTWFPNQTPNTNYETIFAIKKIEINWRIALGLIYQLFFNNKAVIKDINVIKERVKQLGWEENTNKTQKKTITIVIFESDSNQNQNANKKSHTTKSFREAIDIATIYFCESSLQFLETQRLYRMMNPKNQSCLDMILKYKKWIDDNVSLLDAHRFMILSSAVLFTHGVRKCNDLDLYVHWLPESVKFQKMILTELVNSSKNGNIHVKNNNNHVKNIKNSDKNMKGGNANFEFLDVAMKGTQNWVPNGKQAHWDEWFLKEWPKSFGANNISDAVFDPKYHYYFIGLKIIGLNADIQRRLERRRPASYANIIGLNEILELNIDLPSLPKEYYPTTGKKLVLNTPDKIKTFLTSIKFRLRERYGIKTSIDEIADVLGVSI